MLQFKLYIFNKNYIFRYIATFNYALNSVHHELIKNNNVTIMIWYSVWNLIKNCLLNLSQKFMPNNVSLKDSYKMLLHILDE